MFKRLLRQIVDERRAVVAVSNWNLIEVEQALDNATLPTTL
jgi:hypothetical protein